MKIIKEKKIPFQVVEKGDRIDIDSKIYFDVLYPTKELNQESKNNNSLVLKLQYGTFEMLFTGDIEKEGESELIKIYKNTKMLQSSFLKLAHHGAKTSTTKEFLDAVNPQIVLIRCGQKQYIWSSK